MSTTRFDTTLKAIKAGAKAFTIDKAVNNIEGWEDFLSKHSHEGTKEIVRDLGTLKKELQQEPLNGPTIKKLVQKLGKETTKLGDSVEGSDSSKIKELGEALESAA